MTSSIDIYKNYSEPFEKNRFLSNFSHLILAMNPSETDEALFSIVYGSANNLTNKVFMIITFLTLVY